MRRTVRQRGGHRRRNRPQTQKNGGRKRDWRKGRGGSGRKTAKRLNCSPKPKDEINAFSCYTKKALLELRDRWNARHPDVKIETSSPPDIHEQLSRHMKDVCNNEACWLHQKGAFGKLESDFSESFAPESPPEWKKNPNEWLSSTDIMKVMRQYEKAHPEFDFIGPTPIDFDTKVLRGECVWEELCHFDLAKLKRNGKTKIGVIFNTDPHNKPGQHWISLFVDISQKLIFFFDSTGDPAPKQVKVLVNRIVKQGMELQPPLEFTVDSNEGVEHQYGDTECGVYSLYFIIHMLEGKLTNHYLKTHILKDEYIQQYRKVFFNETDSL